MNTHEALARTDKAVKIARAIESALETTSYTISDANDWRKILSNRKVRKTAEQIAGVNPASERTWELVTNLLELWANFGKVS